MYEVDTTDAQILLEYSDVFKGQTPDLIEEIEKLNMHKSISIICELIRVRDAEMEPIQIMGVEFRPPFEIVLKKENV